VPTCYFQGLELTLQVLLNYFPGPHLFSSAFEGLEFSRLNFNIFTDFSSMLCLQCCDAVGWVAGRASGL